MDLNPFILLAIAMLNAITAYLGYITHKNMKLLESNTNSIMDRLVESTREGAHAKGMKEEKDKNEANGTNAR